MSVIVRDARPGDGVRLAAMWREHAACWGRERGATVARATTYHASEVSIPFWEERAGYTPRGVTFAKRLA